MISTGTISTQLLIVFVGGGFGSALRYVVNLAFLAALGPAFPWGTVTVNVAGSAIMGVVATLAAAHWTPGAGDGWRLFLMTGILGGFTTFSAFSLDTQVLVQRGDTGAAVLYVAGTVILSVAALALAALATRAWLAA